MESGRDPEAVEELRQWKKVFMSWKRNLCVCVCDTEKNNNFETTVVIFKAQKKWKSTELLTIHPFFFTLEIDLKTAKKTKKGDVESICARVTKHTSKAEVHHISKAEVNLDWPWKIDYGLFWLHTYIHGWFSLFDTNVLTGFMVSLLTAAPAPRKWRAWNLMGK